MEEVSLAIQSAVRTLPQEQREIIVLRVWGSMTFEQAAQTLEISVNTAASRYRYGLEKLREKLKPLV
jgi:RNA polymerase sigma-70 factor (ECF subfamily)